MNQIIDRESELETLETQYKNKGSSLVIIYGRRRVGKTTLIAEFIKNKKALFFLASQENINQNKEAFKEKVADFTNNPLLKETSAPSWDALFKAIIQTNHQTKPIIVIDEFQYLGLSDHSFPSVFQRIWEENLKNQEIMVIFCGSLVSMMKAQTLNYSSPLYGRRTAQICLKQIPFKYYNQFYPNKTEKELIEMYSITGGVPKYIEMFSSGQDIYSTIKNNILNPTSYLYEEPKFLLQQEVSEIGSYFSLIKTIAAGNSKLSAIATVMGVKATDLTKYLRTLIDLEIIEREVPITEQNPEKSKKGLYKIKDNYIKFWFSFVYPNLGFLESGNINIVMDKIQKSLISHHTAFIYEDVCKEKMWTLNANNAWPFNFSALGRYWDKNTEIDIAALDNQGKNLILGECKYQTKPVDVDVFTNLQAKAEFVDWNKSERNTYFILFSISGFSPQLIQLAKGRDDLILA